MKLPVLNLFVTLLPVMVGEWCRNKIKVMSTKRKIIDDELIKKFPCQNGDIMA